MIFDTAALAGLDFTKAESIAHFNVGNKFGASTNWLGWRALLELLTMPESDDDLVPADSKSTHRRMYLVVHALIVADCFNRWSQFF